MREKSSLMRLQKNSGISIKKVVNGEKVNIAAIVGGVLGEKTMEKWMILLDIANKKKG